MISLDMGIAAKPRMGRLDPIRLDVLAERR
jgi:hypothetical protein